MQIKRFEAKTMTAALKLVKAEFGPDAVILSARSLRSTRGIFGAGRLSGVEVTAARDLGWTAHTPPGRPSAVGPNPAAEPFGSTGRSGLFQALNHRLRSLAGRRPLQPSNAAPTAGRPDLAELYHHMLSQDVQRDLAAEFIDQIKRLPDYDPSLGVDRLRAHAATILQNMGLSRAVEAGPSDAPRVVAMVGPSGAGKTTTAVKLAAVQAIRQGRKVGLVTLDDWRIGALEQLRIYSRILKVPLAIATSPEAALHALQDFQHLDYLVVDTPGINPGEVDRRLELRQILEPLKTHEIHLVLGASTCERDLARIIDAWQEFPVNRLAFTRLDEAGTWGCLLNLLIRTGLPLSCLGTGPRIPEDLAEAPLEHMIDRLWSKHGERRVAEDFQAPAADAPAASRTAGSPRFVANRNSDLYHRPECKWALRIKRGNLVQFASAEEAEARRFVPCRGCSPAGADHEAASREVRRISGYR